MFQIINKYRPLFLILSSLFATVAAGLGAITFLLPKNIQDLNIEFIKYFLFSARYEIAFVIIGLAIVSALVYMTKKSLRQVRQYLYSAEKQKQAVIFVLVLIILLLITIGFTWNPIIREGYFLARARYYFWSNLFYTSYMHSLILEAREKEKQGNYVDAIRNYKIARNQTLNTHIKTNLDDKIESLNGRLKYFQLLFETYNDFIKKDGFTREAFFYLSEAFRVDSHNVFVRTELESRLRKISDQIASKTASKFYKACLSNNESEYTEIYQASSWYLFDKEILAELHKGDFGRPTENPSNEACQLTLNYSIEGFLAIIASGWQLKKILSTISGKYSQNLSRSDNEIDNIKNSFHEFTMTSALKSNYSYATRNYSSFNSPLGPKDISFFNYFNKESSKSTKNNDGALSADDSVSGFSIQLISLSHSRAHVAEKIKNEVLSLGMPSYTTKVKVNNKIYIRVMSGPFASKKSAEEANSVIKKELNITGIICKVKPEVP